MNEVFEKFSQKGGKFLINDRLFISKLEKIKLFVFDWDGVFTNGLKDADLQSQFNESDSVGLNLLRFSFYLKHQHHPFIAIISGEKNESAFTLVKREFIHRHYFKFPHKIKAFEHICKNLKLSEEEVAFVFDDVLDLSIAESCGLRLFIQKPAAVLFNEYVIKNQLADYASFSGGANLGVREICELLMGCYENFEETIKHRIEFSEVYKKYLEQKRAIQTENYTFKDNRIIKPE